MKKYFLLALIVLFPSIVLAAQVPITVGTTGAPASLDSNFGNAQSNFDELYGKTIATVSLLNGTQTTTFEDGTTIVETGYHSPAIQSAIDLNTAKDLTAKQDTLVSGTNIKSINSTSLVGAGDVVISGTLPDGTATNQLTQWDGSSWTLPIGCSDGQYTEVTICEASGHSWGPIIPGLIDNNSNSPNVLLGASEINDRIAEGTVGGGTVVGVVIEDVDTLPVDLAENKIYAAIDTGLWTRKTTAGIWTSQWNISVDASAVTFLGETDRFEFPNSGHQSTDVVLTTAIAAGDRAVVLCNAMAGRSVNSVTDTKGNTWSLDKSASLDGVEHHFYSSVLTTGLEPGDTVTIGRATSTNVTSESFVFFAISNSTGFDVAASNSLYSANPYATATTTHSRSVAIAVVHGRNAIYTATDWTISGASIPYLDTYFQDILYTTLNAAGPTTPNGTYSKNINWGVTWVAYY